ncbi:hypothetical protein CPAR01_03848 [Colletotrichum paranaense]|uniref:Uncharacterized protein n=5 Tax=Colletotrichum acutatum species complex TaxID=2707335 RepID=A0AAJ0E3R9_9PEZI|nr:uncharacterized protein CCOS01_06042 [Colletotrichum costaricense]XP_060352340.1 uncharacterized protein CPAR01_03848 [Colletotrichum paranaense]XP_060385936.1 uncharacterized protein CTAM01_03698 [Colletotrichum tamarilloi]KAI3542387.1 hypothetical protein CSPX01_06865 [Colletotrichum filicis]KAK0371895.1 hypothetical protein CLIM01_10749 [Colletotrichum limetticola]KAK1469158.1 hypothetical protein CMEL01_00925 [Colletotrichum melonis]KAK1506363.1 hypothetical protein CTAM01_03698 [Colle
MKLSVLAGIALFSSSALGLMRWECRQTPNSGWGASNCSPDDQRQCTTSACNSNCQRGAPWSNARGYANVDLGNACDCYCWN